MIICTFHQHILVVRYDSLQLYLHIILYISIHFKKQNSITKNVSITKDNIMLPKTFGRLGDG